MKPPLDPADGFRMWSSTYDEENPLTELDLLATRLLLPDGPQGDFLDAGCGTGRRMPRNDLRGLRPVGLDLVPAMLAASSRTGLRLVAGSIDSPPFGPRSFDTIWCRLVIGFLPQPETAIRALAGLLRPGGRFLLTDLHPDLAAGGRRVFRGDQGQSLTISSFSHPASSQRAAVLHSGLEEERCLELCAGPEVEDSYIRLGAEALFAEHSKRPVILASLWRRPGVVREEPPCR